MGVLLKWLGIVWAIIGVANIAATSGGGTTQAFGLMFNVLLFIFPGLLVAGLGAVLQKKSAAPAGPSSKGPDERIRDLKALLDTGAISQAEFDKKKAEIISSV